MTSADSDSDSDSDSSDDDDEPGCRTRSSTRKTRQSQQTPKPQPKQGSDAAKQGMLDDLMSVCHPDRFCGTEIGLTAPENMHVPVVPLINPIEVLVLYLFTYTRTPNHPVIRFAELYLAMAFS